MTPARVKEADLDIVRVGAGRDLVLLHSLLTDRSAFDLVAPPLAKTRRLTLVNLPGYGASGPAGEDVESYADRIAAMIAALRLPRQTDILGNGFGGFIAVALDIAIRRMFPEAFIAAHPQVVSERRRALEKEADARCFQRACLALARLDFTPVLGKIRNPTLVMAGALDQTTPPVLARALANGIPGAKFLEIPGCGHCPQIENPQAFIDAVNDFLPPV